jgi:hypothetical protein
MRKLALALAVVVAAALPGISGAVQPDAVREEEAMAFWSVPTSDPDHFIWYFAYGRREVHATGDPFSVAGVGKGHCVRHRSKRGVNISCNGRGGAHSFNDGSFVMAPTASSARINFIKNGRRYSAIWAERKKPRGGFYTTQIGCNGGGGAGAGILWEPHATGRIYGKKLTPKYWWDFSMTTSGGYVMECGDRLIGRLLAGKSIHLTFTR